MVKNMVPVRRKSAGKFGKRWMNTAQEELHKIRKKKNWQQLAEDRKGWRALVTTSRGLLDLIW